MYSVIILSLLSIAAGQSSLSLAAQGAVDNNSAASAVQGMGEKVTGSASISADNTVASSTASVTATSAGPTTPTPTPTPVPTSTPTPTATPTTATATASATATGTATASAMATTIAVPTAAAVVAASVAAATSPAPTPMVYYKKMKEEKPKPTCADIKDDMCPAMSEFDNCGYCILQKYPLVGYGCPVEKMLVKKQGTEGEYEVVTKPMCDCPQGALYIHEPTYCPSCQLALTELAICSGYNKIPKDISKIEIVASCLEKVMVSVKYLEECGFIKPAPTPIVLTVEKKEDKKDPKKYAMVKPKEVSPKVIVVDPVVKGPKPVPAPVTTVPTVPAVATATATASASASASVN